VDSQRPHSKSDCVASARRFALGGLGILCSLLATAALALTPQEADQLLHRADNVKGVDPSEFGTLLRQLEEQSATFSRPQQQYLQYLKGWQSAYSGSYAQAVPLLESIIREADVTLRFRASATLANVQAVATHYDEAFAQLGQLVALLPQVTDKDARQQGLLVIGYL
jgi:hypothetical protein